MSQANERCIVTETIGRWFFTFTVDNVKQLSFQGTQKVLRSSADQHLYDSEFQIEGALTVNAFADNASVIFGTNSSNLSDERNVPRWLVVMSDGLIETDKPVDRV